MIRVFLLYNANETFSFNDVDAFAIRIEIDVIAFASHSHSSYLHAGAGTFRHTYRSWLDETGVPMKVRQELMRHASIQTTMNVYGQAMTDSKRRANSQVVSLVFGVPTQAVEGSVAIQ